MKLKDRVAALEAEVARLKEKLDVDSRPWTEAIAGSFANEPAFDEAMRLGRKYRESLRPKPTKKKKR
jgi:hypothetical protein